MQLIAGMKASFERHPCGYAARAVAADLGDGAVGVVEADTARLWPVPGKELDAVGADARVTRTQTTRQLRPVAALSSLLGHNQEVVAAGMSFCKGNQSSSGSR